ncbi:MAG TPA: VOC family protein [Ideonella sp.]|nr:VOC family protein [Ideonella sp.]
MTMSSPAEHPFAPPGWPCVVPRIVVRGTREFVGFVRRVFGATGEYLETRPSELWISGSLVMVSEEGVRPPTPAFLYVYVADADAVFARAVEAGARVIETPQDTPYGDRRAMVEDAWGNTWQVATYRKS